jgi:NAD(P)H dehydrogenase (quinone)
MMVVTGANGRLGRLVAHELARLGVAGQVKLTSREPGKLADLATLGFSTGYADFSDPQGLREAFEGASRVLMISMPGPIEARIPRHRNCIDAAKAAGVERLVYTSRVNPVSESLYSFAKIHAVTEDYLRASGLTTTIARNSEYIENILPAIESAAVTGELIMPGATGKVPRVSVTEIAQILAKVLAEEGHGQTIYELNGPEALSRSEVAALIEGATGRPVRGVPETPDAFGAIRASQGRPPFMVDMAIGLFKAVDAGEFSTVWGDAEQLLGRTPKSVRDSINDLFGP